MTRVIEDRFQMRYMDGSALLWHFLSRTGDVPCSDYDISLPSVRVVEIYLFRGLTGRRTP